MRSYAPECNIVRAVAKKYFSSIMHVERVTKGRSTYVYRITASTGVYYMRFLPEDTSFAAEVLVHDLLCKRGVNVPQVIGFEHKNECTGLSMMLVAEIAGRSIEEDWPQANLQGILREAGRQLACIHCVPVDGFSWIDRSVYDSLRGEKQRFEEYFMEYLEHDLQALCQCSFSDQERTQITDLMIEAKQMLHIENAVLVHGDFDISHIFHYAGNYTGIIDFGEIRGNHRLYDLATFIGFYQDRKSFPYLLEGYGESVSLKDKDLYAVELMALFIILRFLGKAVKVDSRSHWYQLAKKQLEHINSAFG